MAINRATAMAAAVTVIFAFLGSSAGEALGAHSAFIGLTVDPPPPPYYIGTSNPAGGFQVNIEGNAPGYFNNISGGTVGGSAGTVGISDLAEGEIELVAVAIHVTDSAGRSHSLSSLNDSALAAIVEDLNNSSSNQGIAAYPYNSAPSQYATEIAALSAGESANGGQPFDIFLTEDASLNTQLNVSGPPYLLASFWTLDFSNEIGNLDGIAALRITDVGAIPEPATVSLLVFGGMGFLSRRRPATE